MRGTIAGIFFLLGAVTGPAHAQDVAVRNTESAREGGVVTITYDLIGEPGRTYRVRFLVSTDGGQTFDVVPQAVSGAVGPGIAPGTDKRIAWRVTEDFPEGLPGKVRYRIVPGGRSGARGGALWRSALLPGLGQFHQGQRTRGWVYVAAAGLALGGVAVATLRHQARVDDYNDFLSDGYTPRALATLSDRQLARRRARLRALYDDAQSAATVRTVAVAVLGGVWATSVIDSAMGGGAPSPSASRNAVRVGLPRVGVLPSDDAPMLRVSLRICF